LLLAPKRLPIGHQKNGKQSDLNRSAGANPAIGVDYGDYLAETSDAWRAPTGWGGSGDASMGEGGSFVSVTLSHSPCINMNPELENLTMKLLRTALTGLSAALLSTAAQASIAITSNFTGAYASAGIGGSSTSFNGTVIPTFTTLDAIDGTAHSNHIIDWSTSGGQTVLSLDIDHHRNGTQYSYAQTQTVLIFTANSSISYELSGRYYVTDVGSNESGSVRLEAGIYDITANAYSSYSFQTSQVTNDEQFYLGATGGDSNNSLLGSLTGNLIGGHTYQLFSNTLIYAFPNGDSGASAVGNITLTIGANSSAPEPLSLLVWGGLAVLSVVAIRRTKRQESAIVQG
jgi:hypothetical protein